MGALNASFPKSAKDQPNAVPLEFQAIPSKEVENLNHQRINFPLSLHHYGTRREASLRALSFDVDKTATCTIPGSHSDSCSIGSLCLTSSQRKGKQSIVGFGSISAPTPRLALGRYPTHRPRKPAARSTRRVAAEFLDLLSNFKAVGECFAKKRAHDYDTGTNNPEGRLQARP